MRWSAPPSSLARKAGSSNPGPLARRHAEVVRHSNRPQSNLSTVRHVVDPVAQHRLCDTVKLADRLTGSRPRLPALWSVFCSFSVMGKGHVARNRLIKGGPT